MAENTGHDTPLDELQHAPQHAAQPEDTGLDDLFRQPSAAAPDAGEAPHHPEHALTTTAPVTSAPDTTAEATTAEATTAPATTAPATPLAAASATSELDESQLLFRARGLEMAGRESMVFGPVDFDLPKGSIGVVTGQQGAGRSALLLALAGRLKGVQGSLVAGDVDGIRHARALRKQVSVARITDFAELEPNLTVGESRDERAIAEGIGQKRGRQRFAELEDLLGHRFELDQWVDRLPGVERTLLTLVLGCLAPARYVVVDDIDDSLTDAQLRWVYDGMALLLGEHDNFVVSALDQSPLPPQATVLHLPAPPPRVEPNLILTKPVRHFAALREDA